MTNGNGKEVWTWIYRASMVFAIGVGWGTLVSKVDSGKADSDRRWLEQQRVNESLKVALAEMTEASITTRENSAGWYERLVAAEEEIEELKAAMGRPQPVYRRPPVVYRIPRPSAPAPPSWQSDRRRNPSQ